MKPAFAMTINKSQGRYTHFFQLYSRFSGKTLKNVGIWLKSNGSRVGKPESLKFAIMKEGKKNKEVDNVVFKEVLL